MRKLNIKLLLLIAFACCVAAQAQQTDCPHPDGCVVISRGAAIKALENEDKVKAQEAEILVKNQAIDDLKKEIAKMQIELAKVTGELTGAEKSVVRLTAITDVLLKHTRKKCMPLSICF